MTIENATDCEAYSKALAFSYYNSSIRSVLVELGYLMTHPEMRYAIEKLDFFAL